MGETITVVGDVEWHVSRALVPYPEALAAMEERVAAIASGAALETIWLLEHPPLYTAGTSAVASEVLDARFPVYPAGRGGRHTYHGPGQRVVYVMIDVGKRGRDVRGYVHALENWVIAGLGRLAVTAWSVEGRVGIWTHDRAGREAKIGAIGVRVRRWVSLHGFAVNVAPNLADFSGIVPCGLPEFPVTSLAALGNTASMDSLDAALSLELQRFLETLAKV